MSYALKLFIATAAGALIAFKAAGEPAPCPTCEPPKEQTMRERIKSDRDRYDRENLKSTARPWDGLNLGRAQPDKKTPVVQ